MKNKTALEYACIDVLEWAELCPAPCKPEECDVPFGEDAMRKCIRLLKKYYTDKARKKK